MNTDREFLEYAAKAVGMRLNIAEAHGDENYLWSTCLYTGKNWNPLTDDGDALRLAVKFGISVSFSHSTSIDVPYPTIIEVGAFAGWCPTYTESNSDDWGAATRRAIVRAAAEIGKNMP